MKLLIKGSEGEALAETVSRLGNTNCRIEKVIGNAGAGFSFETEITVSGGIGLDVAVREWFNNDPVTPEGFAPGTLLFFSDPVEG